MQRGPPAPAGWLLSGGQMFGRFALDFVPKRPYGCLYIVHVAVASLMKSAMSTTVWISYSLV